MERRHGRAKRRETEAQNGLYQIASQAECTAAALGLETSARPASTQIIFIMNHEDSPKKRKTVKIRLQPKPAAPRHPYAVTRAVALPSPVHSSQKKRSCFVFPMVQVTVVSFLGIMTLDFGECSHVVAYAALGYLGGLLMMAPRRNALTATDEMLIRWGFIILFFVSSLISAIIWPLRMRGM